MNVLVLLSFLFFRPSSLTEEKALIRHLLTNSSIYARPVINSGNPVVVTFGFSLIQLTNVVEHDQYITTKIWMRMSWVNELLRWDPEHWGSITRTRLSRDVLWTPDIFLQEDVSPAVSSGPEKYRTSIVIHSDGTHMWLVPVKLQSNCIIDVTSFPFDQQICKFIFGSWTHDQSELYIKAEKKATVSGSYINSSEWKLLGVERKLLSTKYACCVIPFAEIQFTLKLQRKPLYYVYNIVLPCVIQMVIILFTFFLPPDSGERIGVLITVLLVFAVYLEVLSRSLPKTSNTVPALSQFYVTTMIESACSLIATCFVLTIHFKGTEKGVRPMPHLLRKYFLNFIGNFFRVTRNKRVYANKQLADLKTNVVFANELVHHLDSDIDHMIPETVNEVMYRNGVSRHEAGMNTLVDEIRVITSLVHEMNREDEIEEEWQGLAKVMDRIFFFIFLIIFAISSLFILLPAYMKNH